MSNHKIFDILGIGFGPANIALAIALEDNLRHINCKFLEASSDSLWQGEMLLDSSDIQNIPYRDLITPINPRSQFTFTNYLVENNLFFDYMNLMVKYPFRKNYAQYIKWCADFFSNYVDYNTRAVSVYLGRDEVTDEEVYFIKSDSEIIYRARSLVIGTGRTPYIPKEFTKIKSEKIVHSTRYLSSIKLLESKRDENFSIAVIGGSQSAVEIILDLSKKFPNARIVSFLRKFSFIQKNLSPFSYEMLYPDFIDYYFNLNQGEKEEVREHLYTTNYSSVDADILDELYQKIYEQKIEGNQKIWIKKNTSIETLENFQEKIKINYKERYTKEESVEDFDCVILATGFKDIGLKGNQENYPPILKNIINYFCFNSNGLLDVRRDYSLSEKPSDHVLPPCYLNGLCETSHGFSDSGSISLLSFRAKYIKESVVKYLNNFNKRG